MKRTAVLLTLPLILLTCRNSNNPATDLMDTGKAEEIVRNIEEVSINGPVMDLSEISGKNPDEAGTYNFQSAIQSAIDSLHKSGGGTLLFSHVQDRSFDGTYSKIEQGVYPPYQH